jgi:hypothetical protein
MSPFKVKPTQAFKLLGTGIVLDPQQTYLAVDAVNVPGWRDTRRVYLLVNSDGSPASLQDADTAASFLLTGTAGEYTLA